MKNAGLGLMLFLGWVGLASAQMPEVSFEGARAVGADVGFSWGSFKLIVGGGYELVSLGRDVVTGEPRPASDPKADLKIPDGKLLARQTWTLEEAEVWVAGGAWGQGDLGLGPSPEGVFADRRGGFFGLVQGGVLRDRQTPNARGVRSGLRTEAALEVGPAFLSASETDYVKATATASYLLPLWDLESTNHLFSGVFGLRAGVRWLDGSTVPVLLFQATDLRGYQAFYDTKFSSVGSAELRVALPSLAGVSDVVPLVFGFSDVGWHTGYANAPASSADRSSLLASVGAGLALALFGAVTPTATIAFPLREESDLWWSIEGSLRF